MRPMHEEHIRRVAEARQALEAAQHDLDSTLEDAWIDGPLPGDELDCWSCGQSCKVVRDEDRDFGATAQVTESFAQRNWLSGWSCGDC